MPDRDRGKMLGVVTAELNNSYQTAVWRGIERRAAELGYGVITFRGSNLDSPIEGEATSNFVYDLASHHSVDGLVVISAAIATYIGDERLRSAFQVWRRLPTVSVGVRVPQTSSVIVDGSDAIDRLVRHLAGAHHRRRFALVGGPPNHAEVVERREAYTRSLSDLHLPLDPRLVAAGRWTRESGGEAVDELLQYGLSFDALFCMNDLMAIGAIRRLRGRGIRVPEEVSVIGFDGLEEGQSLIRPLSCAAQPLVEVGAAAVDSLDRLLAGNEPEHGVLRCGVIFGESCGCAPAADSAVDRIGDVEEVSEREKDTVERLARHAELDEREAFLEEVNRAAAGCVLDGKDPVRWSGLLASLRQAGPERSTQAADKRPLFEAADALIGEIRMRRERARAISLEERFERLWAVSSSLAGSFDLDLLLENLRRGMIDLGIGEGFVVLFTPGKPRTWGRLVSAPGTRRADQRQFRTRQLLPSRVGREWRRVTWVLEPLVFQREPLGYMLLPGGYEEPQLYESLRDQVSSALKGALLLERVRSHERILEREVRRRTAELMRANAELTREVDRRERLEREVVDVSNRTMERIGQDLHDDLCQHLAGIAMLSSVVEGSLTGKNAPEVDSVRRIGELLEGSITRAKQIARGLTPTGLESHGLPAAIESLVETTRKNYQIEIDFRASPSFSLSDTDRALQVYRIVQEALSNAVKHSGSDRIVVTLSNEERRRNGRTDADVELVAEVRDTGEGITGGNGDDGMGLRIMRYRAEKAGVKLEILPGDPGTRVICRVPLERRKGV